MFTTKTITLHKMDAIAVNDEFQLLICKRCKAAVKPGDKLISHMRKEHNMTGEDLRHIQQVYSYLEMQNPETVNLPPPWSTPQPILETLPGQQCPDCSFSTKSMPVMRKHVRAAHPQSSRKPTTVLVQSWMGGKYARYWTVGCMGRGTAAPTEHTVYEQSIQETIKSREEKETAYQTCANTSQGLDHDHDFVKYMEWIPYCDGKNRAVIAASTLWVTSRRATKPSERTPDEDHVNARLIILGHALEREVQRCVPRIDAVPRAICQLTNAIAEKDIRGKPFEVGGKHGTLRKYTIIMQRYLSFCWRAYQMGRDEAHRRIGIVFTDDQWGIMADIARETETIRRDEEQRAYDSDGEPISEGSEYESDSSSGSELDDAGGTRRRTRGRQPSPSPQREGRGATENDMHSRLDHSVHRFMMASIEVGVGGKTYSNALMCFSAAVAISSDGKSFSTAGLFTGILAGILWICRLLFLDNSFQACPPDAEEVPIEAMEAYTAAHAKWMCMNTFTVVGNILRWMAYGKGHRKKTQAVATVRVSDDQQTIIHDGQHIRIRDFQAAAHSLRLDIDKAMDRLFKGEWGTTQAALDLQEIKDDFAYVRSGHSFATDERNKWLGNGPTKIMSLWKQTFFDPVRNDWKRAAMKKWLDRLRALKELLFIGCHVWGGQPGRGPEITTMRHCDSLQVMRNVFIYDGAVMLVTDRDKAKSIRDMGRKVARFLPKSIGRAMVAYIAWLLPAEWCLEELLKLPSPSMDKAEFMWRHGRGEVWSTAKLSGLLARWLGPSIGVRIGVARYRTLVIEMGRIIQGITLRQLNDKVDEDDDDGIEVDELSGEVIYVGGSWNIMWDLQSTHSTRTARQHYAVHVGLPGNLHPTIIYNYRAISNLWHQFLELGSPAWQSRKRPCMAGEQPPSRRIASEVDIATATLKALQDVEGAQATWRSPKQAVCMHTIMRMQGAEQLICVLPTGAGKSVLFMAPAVMRGTGTTVVIVPFTALIDDLAERARSKGVDVLQYTNTAVLAREALPGVPKLVLVSADIAVGEGDMQMFMNYMDRLASGGHLQRIFIDEAHVAATDWTYRASLGKLTRLHRFKTPIIMLTATLMKSMETEFREMMLLRHARIIRDRTTKLNARYEFYDVGKKEGAILRQVVLEVAQATRSHGIDDKGIVYCKSVDDTRETAEAIGCEAYHSGMSDEARSDVLSRWAGGQGSRFTAATTALGAGIDKGSIKTIVHHNMAYGLIEYMQQTGRGGRRLGEMVRCITLHDGKMPWSSFGESSIQEKNRMAMWAVAASPGCIREQLAIIMDGVFGETCASLEGAIPCGRCAPGEKAKPQTRARREIRMSFMEDQDSRNACTPDGGADQASSKHHTIDQEQYAHEAERFNVAWEWLAKTESKCAACMMRMTMDRGMAPIPTDHKEFSEDCESRHCIAESYQVFLQRLKFGKLSSCFRCKLPLDWCEQARVDHGLDQGQEQGCVYMDKVVPSLLMAISQPEIRDYMEEKHGVKVGGMAELAKWLTRRRILMETQGTNMHQLFVSLMHRFQQV